MIDKIFSGIHLTMNLLYTDVQTFSGHKNPIQVEKNFTINKIVMNREDAHKYVDIYFDELEKYGVVKRE